MERSCELEGKYRYLLRISISEKGTKALFVLCNPSTADAAKDDTTTRNLQKWAKENGVGVVIVTNLYAYRASGPNVLAPLSEAAAVGEKNMEAIARTVAKATEVIVAWGNPPKSRGAAGFQRRIAQVLKTIRQFHQDAYCLGMTQKGQPRHPRVWYMTPERQKTPYT